MIDMMTRDENHGMGAYSTRYLGRRKNGPVESTTERQVPGTRNPGCEVVGQVSGSYMT